MAHPVVGLGRHKNVPMKMILAKIIESHNFTVIVMTVCFKILKWLENTLNI